MMNTKAYRISYLWFDASLEDHVRTKHSSVWNTIQGMLVSSDARCDEPYLVSVQVQDLLLAAIEFTHVRIRFYISVVVPA